MIKTIGASGFVGTLLLELLQKQKKVVQNIDKNPSHFFNDITSIADVRSTEQISGHLKGAEKIVLLAAEHRDDVSPTSLYYDVNVQGTKNVLDAMDQNGAKKGIFKCSVADMV